MHEGESTCERVCVCVLFKETEMLKVCYYMEVLILNADAFEVRDQTEFVRKRFLCPYAQARPRTRGSAGVAC